MSAATAGPAWEALRLWVIDIVANGDIGRSWQSFTPFDAGRRKRGALLLLQSVQGVTQAAHGALAGAPLVVRRRAAVDDLRDQPQRLMDLAPRREEREPPLEARAAIPVVAPLGSGALAATAAAPV